MLSKIGAVLASEGYLGKFIAFFLVFIAVTAFLTNIISFPGILRGQILVADPLLLSGVAFAIVFSFLAGLSATIHVFRLNEMKSVSKKQRNLVFLGGGAALFTSACSVCYPLILTIAGIPAALAFLPFGGIELQLASLILVVLSIYIASMGLECRDCKPTS